MRDTREEETWKLSQKEIDSIRTHPLPESERLKLILDVASLGSDAAISHVHVYWLGVLHGQRQGGQVGMGK